MGNRLVESLLSMASKTKWPPSSGRLVTAIDAKLSKLILTYASSPDSEPSPFGGRREALLDEVNEGEGGGARHAIDDAFVVNVVVGIGGERGAAARAAEAAAVRLSDLRGAEALRAVAGAERRDRSADMARSLRRKERDRERNQTLKREGRKKNTLVSL